MSEAEIEIISNENFTCINCNVKFHTADIQREHYKTDWHRYNLKRRIADLPPVTAESFQLRVIQQRNEDQIAIEQTTTTSRCTKCQKIFNSIQARDNHFNSRKHKDKMKQCEDVLETTPILRETTEQEKVLPINKEPFVMVITDGNGDVDIEEVDSDEWDDIENPIINDDCLFCTNHSDDFVTNLKHMSIAHSFFVPDTEYVCDLEGLLMYLGEKITRDFICIWCNDSGKTFYSLDAVRKHMHDKGHCKMLHEGLSLAEYTDFYDYSSSYPDKDESMDVDEEIPTETLDGDEYQLVLPSGAVIGHRSLLRYYKQRLNPNRQLVPSKSNRKLHKVLAEYKSLGWTNTQQHAAAKKARDIHHMKRQYQKWKMQVGVKANKLQRHFRQQIDF